MPKDNHSLMQLYLDGSDKNFFTFFSVKEKNVNKMNNSLILNEKNFLKNKSLQEVKLSQRKATEKVFIKKLLPFRSFEIEKRDETTLGELFSFFILETILLGKFLGVNPYDQPSVELIKQETKKILF
jgi:glucose-6-phosphate isomerase